MRFKLSAIKSFVLQRKKLILICSAAVLAIAALLVFLFVGGKFTGGGSDESAVAESGDNNESQNRPNHNSNGGNGDGNGGAESEPDIQPGYEAESRPEENMEIPYEETRLYHIFDNVDKHYLYMRTKQHVLADIGGYVTHNIEYAFRGNKFYLHQEVNGEELFYYSDGEQLYGLDFEDSTYTVISPTTYTPDEILYLGDFTHCSNTGKDMFMGEEMTYEDFTESSTRWIRYFFNEDDSLAGYVKYDTATNEIVEMTYYEAFTSEFPEDAVLYFDIPAGFDKYTDVIDFSDLFWE